MMSASGLTVTPPRFHFRCRSDRFASSQRSYQSFTLLPKLNRRDAACPLLQRACLSLPTQRSNAMIVRATSASFSDMADDSYSSGKYIILVYEHGLIRHNSNVLLHTPKAEEEALVFPLRDWIFHLLVADWDILDGICDPALHQRTKRLRSHVFSLKLRFTLGGFQLP